MALKRWFADKPPFCIKTSSFKREDSLQQQIFATEELPNIFAIKRSLLVKSIYEDRFKIFIDSFNS